MEQSKRLSYSQSLGTVLVFFDKIKSVCKDIFSSEDYENLQCFLSGFLEEHQKEWVIWREVIDGDTLKG